MSSVLNPLPGLPHTRAEGLPNAASVPANEAYFHALRRGGGEERKPAWPYWLLAAAVVGLHGAAIVAFHHRDTGVPPKPLPHKVEIAFIKPEEPPPPPPEPPKPPPPPPPKVVKHVAPPPPQPPVQQLHTAPAEHDIAPNDLTVAENTQAPKSSAPVAAAPEPQPPVPPAAAPVAAPPAPPTPKVEEPITEATANAAYLNNPKPDYPAAAARQGWGGTVVLRVRVLADGHAEGVEVKKSSGRKILDESAIAAVKKWTFVPSKRGSTPIDGWANVPIVFNPEQ